MRVLKQVQKDYPNIFGKPKFILNMDETVVSGAEGKNEKVISPADSRYGGARVGNFAGNVRHVTAVVITSAAGHCLQPFFSVRWKVQNEGMV